MVILALLLWLARNVVVQIFTDDASVQQLTKVVLPAVAASQIGACCTWVAFVSMVPVIVSTLGHIRK